MIGIAELSNRIKISGYKRIMSVPESQDNEVFYLKSLQTVKETLINRLHERVASLRGTHILAYLVDMSRLLRSVCLLVGRINQCFLKD